MKLIEHEGPIPWSTSKFWCPGCQCPTLYEFLSSDGLYCQRCRTEMENRTVTNALSHLPELMLAVNNGLRPKVNTAPVVSKLLEKMGGEVLGQRYAEKLQEVLDSPDVTFKEVRQWLNGAIRLIQRQEQLDKDKPSPIGDMSDDELKDMLRPMAIQMMQTDRTFFEQVMAGCSQFVDSTAVTLPEATAE